MSSIYKEVAAIGTFFENSYGDEVIAFDMRRISPQGWFDMCIGCTCRWLRKSFREHGSSDEVDAKSGAAIDKCIRMSRGLVPEFEKKLEHSEESADFALLCEIARKGVSEMIGNIIHYVAEMGKM